MIMQAMVYFDFRRARRCIITSPGRNVTQDPQELLVTRSRTLLNLLRRLSRLQDIVFECNPVLYINQLEVQQLNIPNLTSLNIYDKLTYIRDVEDSYRKVVYRHRLTVNNLSFSYAINGAFIIDSISPQPILLVDYLQMFPQLTSLHIHLYTLDQTPDSRFDLLPTILAACPNLVTLEITGGGLNQLVINEGEMVFRHDNLTTFSISAGLSK